MQNEVPLPKAVSEAYPLLISDTVEYVGRFTPEVPKTPDRIYDVYKDNGSDMILTHATTDYPDPIHDGEELRSISEYSFKNIIIPNAEGKAIEIVANDDIDEEFFVKVGDAYHYVANTEKTS